MPVTKYGWFRIACEKELADYKERVIWVRENCEGILYFSEDTVTFHEEVDAIMYNLKWGDNGIRKRLD